MNPNSFLATRLVFGAAQPLPARLRLPEALGDAKCFGAPSFWLVPPQDPAAAPRPARAKPSRQPAHPEDTGTQTAPAEQGQTLLNY